MPTEISYGLKHAVVDNSHATQSQMRQMLKTSPFPRFERQGLLDLSEDDRYFVVNPALLEALTSTVRESLRKKAIGRLVEHFGEDEGIIEAMVVRAVGYHPGVTPSDHTNLKERFGLPSNMRPQTHWAGHSLD
jgi:hypothetical protein